MERKPIKTIKTKNGVLRIFPPKTPPTEETYKEFYKALAELLIEEKESTEKKTSYKKG